MGKVARPYPSGHLRLYKTKRQKPGAAVPVQMEYVVHSTPVRRSTGVTVKESDWDPKANKGRGGLKASYGPDYRNINNRLIHKLEALDDKIARWSEENPNRMTVETLRAFLDGTPATRPDKGIDFCEFVKGHLKNAYRQDRVSTEQGGFKHKAPFKS